MSVATSALVQVPWVQATLPEGQHVGIITISASKPTSAHLRAAGVPDGTPVMGTEDGEEFFRVLIRAEKADPNAKAAARDILCADQALMPPQADIRSLVLGCTNLPSFAHALRAAVGVLTYEIYMVITWFHGGVRPRDFTDPPVKWN